MEVLQKMKIYLPYDPAIDLLSIYPKECNSTYKKDTCTLMFFTALFSKVMLWNQPKSQQTMNRFFLNVVHTQ
jgi:hypothetical protein